VKVAIVSSSKLSPKTLMAEAYIPGAAVQTRVKKVRALNRLIKVHNEKIVQLMKEIDDIEQEAYVQATK
jgi:hypothetical protein